MGKLEAEQRRSRMNDLIVFIKKNPTEKQIIERCTNEITWLISQPGHNGTIRNTTLRQHITDYRKKIMKLIPFEVKQVEDKLIELKRDMISVINGMDLEAEEYLERKNEIESFPLIKDLQDKLDQYAQKNKIYKTVRITLDYLKTPQEIQDAIQAGQKQKLNNNLENQKPLDEPGYIAKCNDLMFSSDSYESIIGIIGLTGRRPQEVIEKGTFKGFKNKKDHWTTIFTGQQKTRDKDLRDSGYEIPVLTNPKKMTQILNRVRKNVKTVDYKKLEDLIGLNFINIISRDATAKTLRSAYATICSKRFKPKSMSRDIYINKILGHAKGDTRAQQHYKIFEEN